MERRDFLKKCGMTCLGASVLAAFVQSCTTSKMVEGDIEQSDLVVPVDSFKDKNNSFKKYVVVYHDKLKYPVCVYRFDENLYVALLMRCTHQGAELQVMGDKLYCPAHGSEFSNRGVVEEGPADTNLRTFPVAISKQAIHISLK